MQIYKYFLKTTKYIDFIVFIANIYLFPKKWARDMGYINRNYSIYYHNYRDNLNGYPSHQD